MERYHYEFMFDGLYATIYGKSTEIHHGDFNNLYFAPPRRWNQSIRLLRHMPHRVGGGA